MTFFSNEIILIIIKFLCVDIINIITKSNYHYFKIPYHKCPKKQCDKYRIINKCFSNLVETEFLKQLNKGDLKDDFEILVELQKISCSKFKQNQNYRDFFKNTFNNRKYFNFWEKIILNLCSVENNESISDIVINFGCFKYF